MSCTKRRYTEGGAKIALSMIRYKQSNGDKKRKEVRSYRCKACGSYHLTSQEDKYSERE